MPPSVSIVIPVFDEESHLPELVRRTLAAARELQRPFEIILVDDGSHDTSRTLIEEAATAHPGEVLGLMLNRNYGQQAAVMAGLAQARGAMVVTLGADLQVPPEEVAALVVKMDEGMDVVGTVRVPRCDRLFRRFLSVRVNRMTVQATGAELSDYACMLRAYRRPVVQAMLACQERRPFIPALANSFARRTAEIAVRHTERRSAGSKDTFWERVNRSFDLLTSITTLPLRLLTVFGALICLAGVALGAGILVLRLALGPEWAALGVFTLFAILFFFVGLQFIAMGILGEYISRICVDTRGRPRYFVETIRGESRLPPQVESPRPAACRGGRSS